MSRSGLTMKISGDRELMRKLETMDKNLRTRVSKAALRRASVPVLQAQRTTSPDDTGTLRRALARIVRSKNKVSYAIIGPRYPQAAHAHFTEGGTQERVQQKTGRRVGRVVGVHWMRRAFDASSSEAFSIIKNVLRTFFELRGK